MVATGVQYRRLRIVRAHKAIGSGAGRQVAQTFGTREFGDNGA